jgi:hypothetical protein
LCAEVFKKTRNVLSSPAACEADFSFNTGDPIIKAVPLWFAGKKFPDEDKRASFFLGLLDNIIQNRKSHTRSDLTSAARKYVSQRFNDTDGLRDNWPKFTELVEELSNLPRSELTLTQQFEKFKGTISHALLLFFQRDCCEELLEFPSQNPRVVLNDEGMIAAALLFGARDGWSSLAKKYRGSISRWVTSVMAWKAHHSEKAILQIHDCTPKRLREFFALDVWSVNEKYAVDLARKYKWGECLQLTVTVPESFNYNNKDRRLVVSGDPKTKMEVDRNLFMTKIRDIPFDEEQMVLANIRGVAG